MIKKSLLHRNGAQLCDFCGSRYVTTKKYNFGRKKIVRKKKAQLEIKINGKTDTSNQHVKQKNI